MRVAEGTDSAVVLMGRWRPHERGILFCHLVTNVGATAAAGLRPPEIYVLPQSVRISQDDAHNDNVILMIIIMMITYHYHPYYHGYITVIMIIIVTRYSVVVFDLGTLA